jgi:hypothetical protein
LREVVARDRGHRQAVIGAYGNRAIGALQSGIQNGFGVRETPLFQANGCEDQARALPLRDGMSDRFSMRPLRRGQATPARLLRRTFVNFRRCQVPLQIKYHRHLRIA